MDCERNLNRYLTIYKKDFVKKPIKLVSKVGHKQEFANPVTDCYKKYLRLGNTNIKPPNEDCDLYLEKFREKQKRLGAIYFSEPLNKDVILKNKITRKMVSEYQRTYCDIDKDLQYYIEQRQRKHSLPDDVDVPLTTYTAYYRNPYGLLGQWGNSLVIKPLDNLETSGKLISTNTSEYTNHIGRLGGLIVKHDLYGCRKLNTS